MWASVCDVTRKVLADFAVDPSSIAAVGLTGYGNGLLLVDRNGTPVRNAILSPDLRASAIARALARRGGGSAFSRADAEFAISRQADAADRLARGA